MMVAPAPEAPHEGFFATWDMLKVIMGATWTVGLAVVGFVWRLATRIEVLEREAEMREEADDNRHKENIHVIRGLQSQLSGVIVRIDQIYQHLARGPRDH